MTVVRMGLLALSLTSAVWAVVHTVYGTALGATAAAASITAFVELWVLLPCAASHPNAFRYGDAVESAPMAPHSAQR